MTHEQAINILSQATEPQAAGRLTRAHFVEIDASLGFLQQENEQLAAAQAQVVQLRAEVEKLKKASGVAETISATTKEKD
jgi:hypothetical protein